MIRIGSDLCLDPNPQNLLSNRTRIDPLTLRHAQPTRVRIHIVPLFSSSSFFGVLKLVGDELTGWGSFGSDLLVSESAWACCHGLHTHAQHYMCMLTLLYAFVLLSWVHAGCVNGLRR